MKKELNAILRSILLCLLISTNTYAYDFEVGGIYYNILLDNQVEVTYSPSEREIYQGAVDIPENVKYNGVTYSVSAIGEWAFGVNDGSEVTSINLPNSIKTIKNNAFSGCSKLQSITIPQSVTSIERNTFNYCSSLSLIQVEQGNSNYDSRNDCNAIIKTSSNKLIVGCKNTIIPDDINTIGDHAFFGNNSLKNVITPSSIKYIEDYAFGACENLESIEFSTNLLTIGQGCLTGCASLKALSIPESVVDIGDYAFTKCIGLNTIVVEQGNAMYDSRDNCNAIIKSSSNLLILGCCNTIIPSSVTKIGQYAFEYLPFSDTISLPDGIRTIAVSAFYRSKIKSIRLPKSLENIENMAFSYCESLTEVYSDIESPFNINVAVFEKIPSNSILYVPQGTKTSYLTTSGWKDNFEDIIEYDNLSSYTLSIKATGNGTVTYGNTSVKGNTSTFTIKEGTSVTITLTPDDGYIVKSLTVNNTDVTSSISNNQYTISSINANTNVEAEFEAIPPTTYTLSIKATGNGTVSYGETSVKGKTSTFTVNEGTSITITLTPDNGYRVKSLTVNNTDVTSSISNNQYTINNINANTYIVAEFEAIPPTTYTLSIKATGNGSVSYGETSVKGKTSTFTVNEGTSITITLTPDNGYRVKSLAVNNTDVTSSISNNQYTISSINANTYVVAEFEAIPPTTYTLSIKATGNGSVSYGSTSIKGKTSTFTINEGTSVTITLTPDNGYRVKSLTVNNTDVTSSISNNQYTINNINANTYIVAEFEAIPPTTYTLSIKATGNGSVSYGETSVKGKTSTFTVNEGTSITITLTPDNGYRVKSLAVNNTDVTSSISNNQYTISSINANTYVVAEYEAIPPTTYTLSIKATGNGSVSYGSTSIKGKTSTFTINEGTSVTITLTPDNGYRVKSLTVNNTDVTSSISNNQYTINSINANTYIVAEFEAIPPTTYTLSIKATGNGSVSYGSTFVKGKTSTFSVNEGTAVTITLTPDNGYRVKSLTVNNTDVTSSISNNQYTINSINANTYVVAEFEVIPPTTYTLSIKAKGNGSVSYGSTSIKGKTSTFSVNEGTSVTITLTPDNGYRVKSLSVNNTDVKSNISNNQYTISNINANTYIEAEFEAIPPTTYTLSIKATGNGFINFDNTNVRNKTNTFTVVEGSTATIVLSPDNGYWTKTVLQDAVDVSTSINEHRLEIASVEKDISLEIYFAKELEPFSVDGNGYSVSSYEKRTLIVNKASSGKTIEIPALVSYQDITWAVTGIDNDAIKDNKELTAIIWEPSAPFTISANNPNVLLYVTSKDYAPATITNIIANGVAERIILKDAADGNDFYCPREFTANTISYTHNYSMATGIGESKGWETIVLPFDVQKIEHPSKGELTPYSNWKSGDNKKPFWLMEYGTGGWSHANRIIANTPYIISMPNHTNYKTEFRVNGNITFSADNAKVKASDNMQSVNQGGGSFVPNYSNQDGISFYSLNINSDYTSYFGEYTEGSRFVLNLRPVRPFEAYMTSVSNATRSIAISDDMTTGIMDITEADIYREDGKVYNLQGQIVKAGKNEKLEDVLKKLPAGIYIVNGKKLIIK